MKQNAFTSLIYRMLLFLNLLGFSSCVDRSARTIKNQFPQVIQLTAEKKKINEIIRPVGMVIYKDYFIIQNDQISDAPCFFVYSLESLDFLYSFGRLGGSSEEYVAPLITQCYNSSYFTVFDQMKRQLFFYELSESGPQLASIKIIQEKTGYPLQELSFINDSIILFLTVENEIISYNLNRDTEVDKTLFETAIEEVTHGNRKINKSLEFFHFSNTNKKIATGHNYIDGLSLNQCDHNGYFMRNRISLKDCTPPFIDSNLFENKFYYSFMETTENLIFAQYYGYSFRRLQPFPINTDGRHFDFIVEVYDWDLNEKAILTFDDDILRCTIDERHKRLFTWNPLKDFESILVYNLSIIM